jgi:hypothetical protein
MDGVEKHTLSHTPCGPCMLEATRAGRHFTKVSTFEICTVISRKSVDSATKRHNQEPHLPNAIIPTSIHNTGSPGNVADRYYSNC